MPSLRIDNGEDKLNRKPETNFRADKKSNVCINIFVVVLNILVINYIS